jgi:hypothetical protein
MAHFEDINKNNHKKGAFLSSYSDGGEEATDAKENSGGWGRV